MKSAGIKAPPAGVGATGGDKGGEVVHTIFWRQTAKAEEEQASRNRGGEVNDPLQRGK